jgi:hypothetical protein
MQGEQGCAAVSTHSGKAKSLQSRRSRPGHAMSKITDAASAYGFAEKIRNESEVDEGNLGRNLEVDFPLRMEKLARAPPPAVIVPVGDP